MRGTLATTTCALALVVMALLPAPCHAVTSSTGAVHARQSLRLAKRPRLDWSTSGGAVGNVAQMPASPYAMAEARLATDDTVPADLVASFDNFDDDYDMDHDATPVVARPADMADRVGGDLPFARILDLVDHRTFASLAAVDRRSATAAREHARQNVLNTLWKATPQLGVMLRLMVTEAQYPEQPLPSSSERHVLKSTTHRSILDLAGMVVKRHPRGSGFWLHSQLLNELRAFASHSHYTVLHYAAARADLLLVRALIQMGAPYDAVHRYIDETGAERHGVMPVEVVRSSEHHHAAEVVDYLTSIDNAFRRVRADDITWMRKWLAGQVEKPMDARDMRGRTMLHYAQSLKMARLLVGHGATVNVYDDRDISPLGVFIGMDRMDIVRWLLVEQGADVDPSVAMVRPLHRAASLPNGLPFVKLLVEHGASVTALTGGARAEQPIHFAVRVDAASTIAYLVEHGASPLVRSMPLNVRPLGYACISGSVNAARALLMYEGVDIDERLAEGNRHLHIAAYAARTEMVRFLLQEAGSLSVNERTDAGFTPLMLAAVAGDALSMRLLLQSGADYTVPMPNGRTLLEGIVATQNVELARALLFSADNINVDETTDPGNTPLCTAVRGDNLELAALLLTYNADPNILEDDPIAESPLHIALTRDNLEMVRLLFGYGANIMLRDEFGFDALALATLVNSAGLVEYLLGQLDRPLISIIGEDGDTPMFYALANNRLAAFSGFLNADNIDWSVVNPRGQTLLHVAIHMDHHAIAMALIERMSDATMTHQDQAGDTALHEACRHSNGIRYVEALMRDGRLLEALGLRNAAYQTPIDIAREKGNMALVEKLQSFS